MKKGATKLVAYVDDDVYAEMERVAAELGLTRSRMVQACIESGLDELRCFKYLGLTPRRIAQLRKVIEKLQKRFEGFSGLEKGLTDGT